MKHTDHEACEPASAPAERRMCAALRTRGPRGFTLIELMVVIAIVAIMVAIAVPAFKGITQQNRIAAEVNTFVGDLQFARAEAIRRGAPVSVCPSSDGATCLSTNVWRTGWIVFSDELPLGAVGPNDTIMRVQRAFAGTDSMAVLTPTTVAAVSFSRDGFLTPNTPVTFVLRTTPVDASATKCVALTATGRQSVQKPGTGSCT